MDDNIAELRSLVNDLQRLGYLEVNDIAEQMEIIIDELDKVE